MKSVTKTEHYQLYAGPQPAGGRLSAGMLYRLRNIIAELLEGFFGNSSTQETEELADEIVEYGRMNAPAPGIILIDVPEVACRLRESPRRIRRSLRLLETKGIAHETRSHDLWKLSA